MNENSEEIAEELYVKISEIMEHGEPDVRTLLRDLIREFYNQMTENENGSKCEEVPLKRIVLTNMYSMEALI